MALVLAPAGNPVAAVETPLVIREVRVEGGAVVLEWTSQPGRIYRVERSVELKMWQMLADDYPAGGAAGSTVVYTDATPLDRTGYYRVVELRRTAPEGFVAIPEGAFLMGDAWEEGTVQERPVHEVTVDAFYIQTTETTLAQWREVHDWAVAHGYDFENAGAGKSADDPVHTVNWHDAVKWCNARSEKENLRPCYFTDAGHSEVYRTGEVDLSNGMVDWTADGYRLPTEAEWEKAARGRVAGGRFPAGDTLSQVQANYQSITRFSYDLGYHVGYHPLWDGGDYPYTSPVGSFPPSGFGLFDMAGNVSEWCWDWLGAEYYSVSPAANPRGPESGTSRVLRGGSWDDTAAQARASARGRESPWFTWNFYGFRAVRRF